MISHLRISSNARARMRNLGLGITHRELISTILEYGPICTLGQTKLADLVGISTRSLQRCLADLASETAVCQC